MEDDLLASSAIGGLWACCRARLTDSLAAMQALERTALETAIGLIEDEPLAERTALVSAWARTIGHLGSLHAQTAARSYDSYLLEQIDRANADDRIRLARDIHDRLGNSLVLAFRHLELFRKKWPAGDTAAERHLTAIQDSLEEATGFSRGLVSGLRAEAPLTSLAEAITDCAATLNFRAVPFEVSVHGDETWLPEHHRTELFLIVREFLRNSFAHAMPESVTIRMRVSPGRVDVEALDDGVGFAFDAEQWTPRRGRATSADRSRGTGLSVMRERAEQLGGQLFLSARPGKGTQVRFWLPLS